MMTGLLDRSDIYIVDKIRYQSTECRSTWLIYVKNIKLNKNYVFHLTEDSMLWNVRECRDDGINDNNAACLPSAELNDTIALDIRQYFQPMMNHFVADCLK